MTIDTDHIGFQIMGSAPALPPDGLLFPERKHRSS
jgi:hypothetical protein